MKPGKQETERAVPGVEKEKLNFSGQVPERINDRKFRNSQGVAALRRNELQPVDLWKQGQEKGRGGCTRG